jgi:hypothetical protein
MMFMGENVENALSWPNQGEREQETALETTSETSAGAGQPIRWVAVRVNLNPGEALVIKGRLESEDIPAVVQQEAFGSFVGLTVGSLGSANVLAPEPLLERALAVLAETFEWTEDDEA